MSNPVSNAEVEDVLSSIRRLVSEDKRPMQTQKPAPQSDRLVLTPALRVAEAPSSAAPAPTPPKPENILASKAGPVENARASAARDDSTAAPRTQDTASLRLTPLDAVEPSAPPPMEKAFTSLRDKHRPEAKRGIDPSRDYSADPYDFAEDDAQNDHSAPADNDGGSFDPFNFDDEANDDNTSQETPTRGLDARAGWDDADELDDLDQPQDRGAEQVTSATAPQASSPLSAKIAALETAIGNIPDRWEPDALGADDYSGTEDAAMAWEDDMERDATGAWLDQPDVTEDVAAPPAASTAEPAQSASPSDNEDRMGLSADDQIIDEEMLRDLVSEIVRAELQGALGERITRNVRKLVRREIHRALTAQELE